MAEATSEFGSDGASSTTTESMPHRRSVAELSLRCAVAADGRRAAPGLGFVLSGVALRRPLFATTLLQVGCGLGAVKMAKWTKMLQQHQTTLSRVVG